MKLLVLSILFISLVVPFIGVESSPPPSRRDDFTSIITRGSSLSTSPNDTSYWLSPSGNIAFGFYKLPCGSSSRRSSSSNCSDRYVVGIWFVKSLRKTLVWTANRNNLPLSKQSSILLTDLGELVLRVTPDNKDRPLLPDLQEPVSYAKMHDTGNFVLYGLNSQIIWESFDYPTDTILGGQKLKDGVDLVSSISELYNPCSGEYKLSIRQTDGSIAIHKISDNKYTHVILNGYGGSVMSPVTLNIDNNTGNLFLVSSDDVVLGKLYENKNQQPTQPQQQGQEMNIYRATLDSKGDLNLFKERIDGNFSAESLILEPLWSSHIKTWTVNNIIVYGILGGLLACQLLFGCYIFCDQMRKKIIKNRKNSGGGGDLELGRS